jgi:hypothetical protein
MNQKLTSRSRFFYFALTFSLICTLSFAGFSSRNSNRTQPGHTRSEESPPTAAAESQLAKPSFVLDRASKIGRRSGVRSSLVSALNTRAEFLPVGDFSVSVSPSSRSVNQGGTATYTVTVTSLSGFNSSVSLFALNLPGNQVLPGTGFSPQTITPPANGRLLRH